MIHVTFRSIFANHVHGVANKCLLLQRTSISSRSLPIGSDHWSRRCHVVRRQGSLTDCLWRKCSRGTLQALNLAIQQSLVVTGLELLYVVLVAQVPVSTEAADWNFRSKRVLCTESGLVRELKLQGIHGQFLDGCAAK